MSDQTALPRRPAIKINSFFHTGFTVKDIHRSIEWYTRILGMQVMREPKEFDSEWLAAVVGYPKVRIILGMVGVPGSHSIELLQYVGPRGFQGPNRNDRCDVGGAHCGMLVDDVRAWYRKLKADGVWVSGEPQLRDMPYPWARYAFYFKDPDGHWLEMVERAPKPEGSAEN
jgi:catechol 2,3-dioxygenase-like lactoylglutathione lyase family enzyme